MTDTRTPAEREQDATDALIRAAARFLVALEEAHPDEAARRDVLLHDSEGRLGVAALFQNGRPLQVAAWTFDQDGAPVGHLGIHWLGPKPAEGEPAPPTLATQ